MSTTYLLRFITIFFINQYHKSYIEHIIGLSILIMEFVAIIITIFFPLTILGFGYFGIQKWKKSKENQYNYWNFFFFAFICSAMIINLTYYLLQDYIPDGMYMGLARFSAFFLLSSVIFPPFFLIGVRRGFLVHPKRTKIFYFGISFLLFVPIWFIGQTSLDSDHNLIYNSVLGGYCLGLLLFYLLPFQVFSYTLWNEFQGEIKKRFHYYSLGYLICVCLMILAALSNMQLLPRSLVAIIYAIGILPGGFLIYSGFERKLKSTDEE